MTGGSAASDETGAELGATTCGETCSSVAAETRAKSISGGINGGRSMIYCGAMTRKSQLFEYGKLSYPLR